MARSKLSELRDNVFTLLTDMVEEGYFNTSKIKEHQLVGVVVRVIKIKHKIHSPYIVMCICHEWLHGGPGVVERCGL